MKEVLYHYCNIDKFCSMMEKGKLRFSDITKSNDSEELHTIMNCYQKFLGSISQKNEQNQSVLHMANWLYNETIENETCYAVCFSEKRDSLSQWRGYAPKGGVMIGFETAKIREYADKIYNRLEADNKDFCKLTKIEYIDVSKRKIDKKLAQLFGGFDNSCPVNNFGNLIKISAQYKNKGFEEEQETRLCFFNFLCGNAGERREVAYKDSEEPIHLGQMSSETDGKKSIITFYDLPFPYEAVTELMIGPKTFNSEKDVHSCFLNSVDLHFANGALRNGFSVTRTGLTYR